MASEIQIVINSENLAKIENFFNDSAYKEVLENSENYNTRLCIERRLRMPFLDPQTGVAQNHCALFMKSRQRMPGLSSGQLYSYPAARWRKSRRQYLIQRPFRMLRETELESDFHHAVQDGASSLGAGDTDSKDSQNVKDEVPKEWFYDMDLHDVDGFDDPDSDFDYEEPYSIRRSKQRRKGGERRGKATASSVSDVMVKKPGARGRGRQKKSLMDTSLDTSASSAVGSAKKPRLGHDEPHCSSPSSSSFPMPPECRPAPLPTTVPPFDVPPSEPEERSHPPRGLADKGKVAPSPYCDFCLGDARENKKTGVPEELVSCSDCGRSGHPTCLQFTANMMISVKRYRWQCIECKYCSICGTSDNDDQLLFCDDCDRGYHMYCLSPALTAPPEGSWSCKLCIEEFHTPKPPKHPAFGPIATTSGTH
ncbi:zinc finger protein DPF3 [Lutzomyia longipalpis]|uniref:zinc finger protein DPF3 n=1 Tax=Lutzomyia longipalpis TaxID=7200 RepID=UPI002483D095|nr:zinc finger protein DPF3 [Lutzomyia longipalpis]